MPLVVFDLRSCRNKRLLTKWSTTDFLSTFGFWHWDFWWSVHSPEKHFSDSLINFCAASLKCETFTLIKMCPRKWCHSYQLKLFRKFRWGVKMFSLKFHFWFKIFDISLIADIPQFGNIFYVDILKITNFIFKVFT